MKRIKIIQFFVLTISLSIFSFGQNTLNSKEIPSIKKDDVRLSVILAQKKVKVGEEIDLKVFIQNNFLKTVIMPYILSDEFGGYLLEIKDSKGNIVKSVEKTKASIWGSSTSVDLSSGKSFKTNKLPVNKFYNLPVGKYSIVVKTTFYTSGTQQKILISSKPEILKVIA